MSHQYRTLPGTYLGSLLGKKFSVVTGLVVVLAVAQTRR